MGRPLPELLSPDGREVLLGMPGAWADENSEPSDHYTTKIGGQPDWPDPLTALMSERLKCAVCGGYLGLVAQIHAPLSSCGMNIAERTLYILGCPAIGCGVGPTSWRTMRVQKNTADELVPGVVNESEAQLSSASPPNIPEAIESDWAGPSSRQAESQTTERSDWWDDNMWSGGPAEESSYGEVDTVNMQELQSSLTEAAHIAASASVSQNSNDSGRVSVMPRSSTTTDNRAQNQNLPVLPCFYIYTQNESSSGERASPSTRDSQLALPSLETSEDGAEQLGEIWESEEYEPDQALFADRTYLKFKKKLDCFPEQCFRYCFAGEPLWAIDEHRDAGRCGACGGPRVYEMQLMPPLLYFLQQAHKDLPPQSFGPDEWDWLTLVVFTCAQSCVQEESEQITALGEKTDWSVIEEATIIQQDLNVDLVG